MVEHIPLRPNLLTYRKFLIRIHFQVLDYTKWTLFTCIVHPWNGNHHNNSRTSSNHELSTSTQIFSGFPCSHVFLTPPHFGKAHSLPVILSYHTPKSVKAFRSYGCLKLTTHAYRIYQPTAHFKCVQFLIRACFTYSISQNGCYLLVLSIPGAGNTTAMANPIVIMNFRL